MSKLKTNEVVLISPNRLVEKTLTLGDDGVVKIDGKEKANVIQEDWIAPTLLNSWVNFGSPYTDAGYMKDDFGFVHLRGMIKNGIVSSPMFNLPLGYRPNNTINFVVVSNALAKYLRVYSDGSVIGQSITNEWVDLSGIIFKAL